jgi:hypothetical protein
MAKDLVKKELLEMRKDMASLQKAEKQNRENRDLQLIEFMRSVQEYLDKVHQELLSHETLLAEVIKTNRDVEETLTHVLVAIRQNEYLQAYKSQKTEPLPLIPPMTVFIGLD